MDINVLIICITVLLCVVFAGAASVYVIDRKLTKQELCIGFLAKLCVLVFGVEEEDDE